MELKRCSTCREEKPLEAFGRNKTMKDGLAKYCRKCATAHSARAQRKARYGITDEALAEILAKQNGRCAICDREVFFGGRTEISGKTRDRSSAAIDHCHKSNVVRGVLCQRCNVGIGHFDDDPIKLAAAIDYLSRSVVHS